MRKFADGLTSLVGWFDRQKRVLPWRDEPTPYRVWVSEIMLQQTQVAAVVPYFERFLARFPSVEILAASPLEDVLLLWAGLGYYARARNLHRGAQAIVAAGAFPAAREGWLDVPGVGDYTAGAVLSIAFDRPEAILDGNVERVMSRLRCVTRAGGEPAYKGRLWRLARAFVERGHALGLRPSGVNQALMELGATLCSPRKPKCGSCPLSGLCRARARGDAESFPPRKKPKNWLFVEERLECVIDAAGRVLLERRPQGAWRAGLWDLPEHLPAGFEGERLGELRTKHMVTRHKITRVTRVWRAGGAFRAAEAAPGGQKTRWVALEALIEGRAEVAVGSPLRAVARAAAPYSR